VHLSARGTRQLQAAVAPVGWDRMPVRGIGRARGAPVPGTAGWARARPGIHRAGWQNPAAKELRSGVQQAGCVHDLHPLAEWMIGNNF